jgi:predicted  nucleic acid-binding Zn-ribbon protein
MAEESRLEEQLAEQRRLVQWLQKELERQRKHNTELRKAVAELARTFQASLAEAYRAGEEGDIQRVRMVTRTNQANWKQYLEQIIAASEANKGTKEQGNKGTNEE